MTIPHYLIHHNGVALALTLLTHAPVRHASELMAIGLGLAVRVKLVENQKHHSVTASTQGSIHILAGVTGGCKYKLREQYDNK